MKRIILCLSLFAFFGSQAQQINPVPDYVFSNKMSVGRNAVTDTAAYFSIGPRYGAIRGMMPPMVTDTASMSATKRNGLLIFSIQKNKYVYWDSVGSKWAEMAGTAGSAITGSGVAGYMPEFTTSTNLDTTRLYHSAGRFAIGSTTTTNGVFNVIGGTTYLEGNLSFGAADRTISNISNNVLAFGTNNTERMRIGANGDVAIGTTNADPFTRGDDRRIAMDASGISSTANVALSLNAGSSAGRGAQLYLGVGGTRHFEISSNSVEQGISAISNTYIKFLTNNTERMRLKADGEVLIGTTTDAGAYALQVAGSIYNTTGAVFAASSGNVGIGTTSPDATDWNVNSKLLHIYQNSTNGSVLKLESSNTSAFFGASDNAAVFGTTSADQLLFYTNKTLRARIDTNGNVGISLNNPAYRLDVNGITNVLAIYTGEIRSQSSNGTIYFKDNAGVNIGNIDGSTRNFQWTLGEFYVGTTTDAGAFKLQVDGAIYNTSTITTGAPTSGSAKPWRLGEAATVSPTSPNRTIRVEIDGTVYYIHAKTTND